jgi:hypothetical protein
VVGALGDIRRRIVANVRGKRRHEHEAVGQMHANALTIRLNAW